MIIKINIAHYNEDYFFTLPDHADWNKVAKELPIVQWLCQHVGEFTECFGISTYGQYWQLHYDLDHAYVKFDGRRLRDMHRTEFVLRFS